MTNSTKTTDATKTTFPNPAMLVAFLGGAAAGVALGLRFAPVSGGRMTNAGRAVDNFIDTTRSKADALRESVSCLAARGRKVLRQTNCAVTEAKDSALSAVNSGARKGHEVVDTAAHVLRVGLRA